MEVLIVLITKKILSMKTKAILFAVISASVIGVLVANSNNEFDNLFKANVEALARSEAVKTKTCWYTSNDMSQPYEHIIVCSDETSPNQIVECPYPTWARKGSSDRCLPQ